MTTEPLYRTEPYLAECSARVLSAGPEGVVLDRTVFYPAGGGQPGDAGWLVADGTEIAVLPAVKGAAPGEVLHPLAEGARLAPGTEVTARIDWETRHRHMRVHTALHLLSVVIPLPVTGGAIGAERGRLDFDMPESPADREALEQELNRLIAGDHKVTEEWITDDDLAANPGLVKTMSVKPPTGQGRVRLIRIGAIDLQPCGGTHVRSTGEIGPVSLGKIEKKGRQNRRVTLALA